jgi:hypothetical protein
VDWLPPRVCGYAIAKDALLVKKAPGSGSWNDYEELGSLQVRTKICIAKTPSHKSQLPSVCVGTTLWIESGMGVATVQHLWHANLHATDVSVSELAY